MTLKTIHGGGGIIEFPASYLLWVSEEILLDKDLMNVYRQGRIRDEFVPVWKATYYYCIFGKEPNYSMLSFAHGVEEKEKAMQDPEFVIFKSHHEDMLKYIREK